MRQRWIVLVTCLLLAACGGEDAGSDGGSAIDRKPALQPDGPLRGVGLVSETGEDGTFTVPQLAFTTDDTEATAIVGLGDDVPEDATLTVDWYRLVGVDGREHLFSHEIPAGPGGHAFSQGVAAGGLAPGLYETVATMGDRLVRTPWVVRIASEAGGAPPSVGGALALISAGSLAQGGVEDWEVPQSGDSGWYEPEGPDTQAVPGPCEIDQIIPGMTPMRDVDASVSWVGTCTQMTLTAAVSGSPQTIASKEIDVSSLLRFLNGAVDVCELPGGSDLPGTAVSFGATGSEGATQTTEYTLPDLGVALIAAAESRPGAGSSVDPGQQIDFHAIGMVMMPALGIEKLDLYVDGVLLESVGNLSGSAEPVACDLGRLYANLVAIGRYRVPEDPPPVIEACAEVLGFDGNKNRDCVEFYTGEVWKGTHTIDNEGICNVNWKVGFVVTDEGEVDGRIDIVNDSCGGGVSGKLTGSKTDGSFTLVGPFEQRTLSITNGDTAKGTFHPHPVTTETWDLSCVSCAGSDG